VIEVANLMAISEFCPEARKQQFLRMRSKNVAKTLLNAHRSPKYPYLRENLGRRIRGRLRKCWICYPVHYGFGN